MMVMPCGLPVEQQGGGRRRRDSELHTTYQNLQRTEEPPAAASTRAVAADIGVLHDRHRQHRAGGDWVVEARGRLGPLTTLVLLAHRNLDLRGTIAESPELVVHEVLTDVSAATYICAKPIFSLKLAAVRAKEGDSTGHMRQPKLGKPQKLRRQGLL
ncbi:hypothetical protein BDL97_10G042000 [Sphagnum fallax]|nr:hypothetical protein BDL97_10G042000 [Sphagnum fallax]